MSDRQARTGDGRWRLSRRSVLAGGAATAMAQVAAAAGAPVAGAAPGEAPVAAAAGETRRVTLYAEALPGGMYGYGLAPGEATVPGPVLEMWEGDTLEIELVNTTDQTLSLHPHGVDYDVHSDGTPLNDSATAPGQRRTHVWRSHVRHRRADGTWAEGTAGYWHYHDHAMGTVHGTEGIRKGLYGALVVRRKGDVLPDRRFTVVFNEMSINNRSAPDAPVFEARQGERAEFVVIGHGNTFHTFHLHAHRWADNRTGLLDGPQDGTP
ncbi:MAG: multicopper oxidase domain-containing protein, partial [Nocardioidaceae bacterium]